LPTTDEQLDDAPAVAAILDSRLRFDVRKRLNTQIAVGDGSSPNLAGFLDDSRTGVQTQARGSDPRFDAIFKAMIKVIYTGGANPSAVVMNPTDWQSVRLARTADGQYIMGNPSQPGPQSLFGAPIAIENSITQGTSLVGDFVNFSYVGENKGIEVQIGYVNDDFTKGRKTLRAETRVCFTVPREAAFCTVTGM
jgi:HK97 family phage major capsid protein